MNRGSRICSPMPYHLAMAPSSGDARSTSLSAAGLCPSAKSSVSAPASLLPNPKLTFCICSRVRRVSLYKFLLLSEQKNWSGRRGSNSLPPPWQGGALPDELRPHIWCLRSESNQRHADFQSAALPSELQRHIILGGNNWTRTSDPLLVRQVL